MMHYLRKHLSIPVIAIALLFVMGCKKDKPVSSDPVITGISPLSGFSGSSVTITGSNFGTVLEKNAVMFNGVLATINSVSATSIVVTVPANVTTGKITLTTNGATLVYPTDFKVVLPVPTVNDVNFLSIFAGGTIIISGNNFDPVRTNDSVKFNGIMATVFSASATQIIAKVYGPAATGKVALTSYGSTVTYAVNINYIPATQSVISNTLVENIAADAAGNIYGDIPGNQVANTVVKISQAGTISTLAVVGTNTTTLKGTAVDAAGNVYVNGGKDYKIYKITPSGTVSTLAGSGTSGYADGQGISAKFLAPASLSIDGSGNLYLCDSNRVRKITPAGLVSTLAGSGVFGTADGQGTNATFNNPLNVAADRDGNVYVSNLINIRKVTPAGVVTTLTFNGVPVGVPSSIGANIITSSSRMVVDASGNLYVTCTEPIVDAIHGGNNEFPVYVINKAGYIAEFLGGPLGYNGIAADAAGNIYTSVTYPLGSTPPYLNSIWKYSF